VVGEDGQTEYRIFVGPWVNTAELADRLEQLQNEGGSVDLQEPAAKLHAERQGG
jgi:hypothetical protein